MTRVASERENCGDLPKRSFVEAERSRIQAGRHGVKGNGEKWREMKLKTDIEREETSKEEEICSDRKMSNEAGKEGMDIN